MANQRINQDENTRRVNISLPPTTISQVDKMTNNGNRSEFIRQLIEKAWQKREQGQSANKTVRDISTRQ